MIYYLVLLATSWALTSENITSDSSSDSSSDSWDDSSWEDSEDSWSSWSDSSFEYSCDYLAFELSQYYGVDAGSCNGWSWLVDGCCSDGNSVCSDSCGFEDEALSDCQVPICDWIGDGWCDGPTYNTEECGFDGGDCCTEYDSDSWSTYGYGYGSGSGYGYGYGSGNESGYGYGSGDESGYGYGYGYGSGDESGYGYGYGYGYGVPSSFDGSFVCEDPSSYTPEAIIEVDMGLEVSWDMFVDLDSAGECRDPNEDLYNPDLAILGLALCEEPDSIGHTYVSMSGECFLGFAFECVEDIFSDIAFTVHVYDTNCSTLIVSLPITSECVDIDGTSWSVTPPTFCQSSSDSGSSELSYDSLSGTFSLAPTLVSMVFAYVVACLA